MILILTLRPIQTENFQKQMFFWAIQVLHFLNEKPRVQLIVP